MEAKRPREGRSSGFIRVNQVSKPVQSTPQPISLLCTKYGENMDIKYKEEVEDKGRQ